MRYQWECKLLQPWWKRAWRSLKKLRKNYFVIQKSTFGYMSKRNENSISERFMHTHVHSSITYNNQDRGTTQVSTDGGTDKEDMIHKHAHTLTLWDIFQPWRRKQALISPIYNDRNETWGHYIKWYKPTEKDKYCVVWFIIHRILKICIKMKTHRSREQKNGCHGLGGWGNTRRGW